MKKQVLALGLMFLSSILFAYCSMPVTLANGSIPCASGLSTDPSKVHAFLWLQGKAVWATDDIGTSASAPGNCYAGCDSDGMDVMDEECLFLGASILGQWQDCTGYGTSGEYYLFTDWSTSPTGIGFDGCPSNDSSERAILLIYDDTGKYVLQSRSQGKVWENWDEIGTSTAIQVNAPEVTYYREFFSDIYLTGIGNLYGSYAAGDAPSSPLVTGFRLYFYFGCSAPSTLATSAWVPAESYLPSTTEILDYDLPEAADGLWIGRALIIDGKDAPFVTGYSPVLPSASGTVVTDGDPCSCTGLGIYPTVGCWDCAPYEDVLVDGTDILHGVALVPDGSPYMYYGTCNVPHSFQFRSEFGDTYTCWSDPIYVTDVSVANPPLITSVVDEDTWSTKGLTIYYTPGTPAIRHDLYQSNACGDPLLRTDFKSGETVSGYPCNSRPGFYIAAVNDTGECQTVYSGTVYGYEICNRPPEIAAGLTEDDALLWTSDMSALTWPVFSEAAGYRLYRGSQSDLQNLPEGTADNSCLKYDGTSTSVDLSGDSPPAESMYWYLVTAYASGGEGSAGTGRIINSSGACP